MLVPKRDKADAMNIMQMKMILKRRWIIKPNMRIIPVLIGMNNLRMKKG